MATTDEQAIRWFVLLSNLLFLAPFGYLLYKIITDKDYNKILNAVLVFYVGLTSFIWHLCDTADSPGDDNFFHYCILPSSILFQADFVTSIVTIANVLSYSPPVTHYWIRDNSIVIVFLLAPYVNYMSNDTSADTNMEILIGVLSFLILLARWILRAMRSDAVCWDTNRSCYCCHLARFPTPLSDSTNYSNLDNDLKITSIEDDKIVFSDEIESNKKNITSCCATPPPYYELSWKIPGKVVWWFPFEGNLTFLIVALILGAAGLACYIVDLTQLYWYLHPAWHSFEAFAILFWFMFVDTIPGESKSYQSLPSKDLDLVSVPLYFPNVELSFNQIAI